MKSKQWTLVAAASSVSMVFAIAGCSGAGAQGSNGSDGKTVTIGASVPKTGPVASAGIGQGCGVEIYFDAANKAGGINGYKVNVETKDNQYEGQASASIAQQFVANGDVAVFTTGTVPIDAARGATSAANVPLFGGGDGAAFAPPKAPGDFTTYPRYQDDMASAIQFAAKDLSASKVSIVVALGAGDASAAALPTIIKGSGSQLGTLVQMNLKDPQWAAWAKQLKDANADAVYVEHVDTSLAQLQKEAANIGYKPKWIVTPFGFGPSYLKLAGDLAEGTYVSQWSWPTAAKDEKSVQKFVADVKAHGGDCAKLVDDPNVAVGYNHAALMAYGIEKASKDGGTVSGETIAAALKNLDKQAIGTSPAITLTDKSHAGTTTVSYWQVKSGALVSVGDWRPILSAG